MQESSSLEHAAGPYSSAGTNYHQGSLHAKRVRAGSITGRLRTCSDLEECGFINRSEKGVMKDLIICGDLELQAALDKYERGDQSELAIICRSLAGRRHSIDILENLDLDFNFLGNSDDMKFGAGLGTEADDDFQGRHSDLGMRASDLGLRGSDVGVPMAELGGDNIWRIRKASMDGTNNNFRSYGFDDFVISNAPTSQLAGEGHFGDTKLSHIGGALLGGAPSSGSVTTRRSPKSAIDPSIFDTHVDMSAYAAHAHQLQSDAVPFRGGRSTYGSGRTSVSSSLKKSAAAAVEMSAALCTQTPRNMDMFSVAGVGAMWGKSGDAKFTNGAFLGRFFSASMRRFIIF